MKTGTILLGGIGSTKTPKIKSIEMYGKRWVDSYGNTYHNTKVYVDDKLVGITPTQYGYGDQYTQSGFALLKSKGYFKRTKPEDLGWRAMEKKKIKFIKKARDVKRKRDLENPNFM